MPRSVRLVALFALAVLVFGMGCRRGRPAATEEPETPSPTPGTESLGEFQLVATVDHAFITIEPSVDITDVQEPQVEEGTAGRVAADVNGVMRVEIEAFSDVLRDSCDADEGDRFNLFWTTQSLFDELLLESEDIEERLDGRRLGIIGTAYRGSTGEEDDEDAFEFEQESPAPTDGETTATPDTSPDASPGVTTAEGEEECILIAEQIGTSSGALPTPRPGATRRPSPTGTSRVSPTANGS